MPKRLVAILAALAILAGTVLAAVFLPVFFLTGQEGKLFTPLAFTKTFVMLASAFLAVTLVPVLMTFIMRTKMLPEDSNPLNRLFNFFYQPPLRAAMQLKPAHRPRRKTLRPRRNRSISFFRSKI